MLSVMMLEHQTTQHKTYQNRGPWFIVAGFVPFPWALYRSCVVVWWSYVVPDIYLSKVLPRKQLPPPPDIVRFVPPLNSFDTSIGNMVNTRVYK